VHPVGGLLLGEPKHKPVMQKFVDLPGMGRERGVREWLQVLNRAEDCRLDCERTVLNAAAQRRAERFRGLVIGIVQAVQRLLKLPFELLTGNHTH